MGLFSSKSSSSQSTTVYNTSVGAAEGSIAAQGDVSILDAGAIEDALGFAGDESARAFEFGGEAFDFVSGSAQDFLDATTDSLDRAFQFAKESLGLVETVVSRTQESTDIALSGALEQTSAALASEGEAQSGGAQRLLYFGAAALVALVILAKVVK